MVFEHWFDYKGIYSLLAKALPENGTFVELGVLQGASLVYMAKELTRLEKDSVNLYGIDVFENREEFGLDDSLPYDITGKMANVKKLLSWYAKSEIIKGLTVPAAHTFADNSIDGVMIDADHSFSGCLADLEAWYPKVKPGGFIVGHDLSFPSVRDALNHFCFHNKIDEVLEYTKGNRCFLILKEYAVR
jgi:predicted O-methyltransferase YrrM